MADITIDDIGVEKTIELAAEITADHYKRLIAVLFIDSNSVLYKVIVDGDIKFVAEDAIAALDYYNDIYLSVL